MKTKIKTKTWDVARKTARHILPALAFMLGLGTLCSGNAFAAEVDHGWGPTDRATYTWDHPADHPTFNSITDNPTAGDERNFVRIKEYGTDDKYRDSVDVEVGKEYEVYILYHNNASAGLNESGKGIANNVRLKVEFPEVITKGQAAVLKGTISATNTTPLEVWDSAYLKTNETVYLRYVANSAVISNLGSANGSVLDQASLFGDGAKLAYSSKYWGVVPGCNEYAGYVTFRIKIDKPSFYMKKTASAEGENNYHESITVKPGDTIDFKINYEDNGTTDILNVIAYDKFPEGLVYEEGSTFVKFSFRDTGSFATDRLFNGGLGLGDFHAGQSAVITYKGTIADDFNLFPCGTTTIYNNSSVATNNGTMIDKVSINVIRDATNDERCKEVVKTCQGVGKYEGNEYPEGDARCAETCEGVGEYAGQTFEKGDSRCTESPVTPEKTCKTNPEMPECQELPNTGPTEIVLAVVIVAAIGIGIWYYVASKKQLNKLTDQNL